MKYKSNPIVIDAIQFNGNNAQEIMEFINRPGYVKQAFINRHSELCIKTHVGIVFPNLDNFIVKGINRDIHVYRSDEFKRIYELLD